ncbi:MAG: ferrous iron transport protein A [Clostridia bacterium]|nr:ferrous iron transport protein A [Clostridia bacterium]
MRKLCSLSVGERATVARLRHHGGMRRRLLDIGLSEGTEVRCVGKSPCGDPAAYLIRGAVIAIRKTDGALIDCVCGYETAEDGKL